MKILGLDPGFATVGFGIITKTGSKLSLNQYGTFSTKAETPFPERLLDIETQLSELLKSEKPVSVGIEELFFNTNQKTALKVAQARGVLLATIARHQIPIQSYTPMQVKLGVSGYGGADKRQVQEMVKRLLYLEEIPKPDDAADALAIAICHAHQMGISTLLNGFQEKKKRKTAFTSKGLNVSF